MLRQRQTPRCLLGAQKDRHKARRPQDGRRGPSKRTGDHPKGQTIQKDRHHP